MPEREAAAENSVDVLNKEIVIFEIPKQKNVEKHADNEDRLFCSPASLHTYRKAVVYRDG